MKPIRYISAAFVAGLIATATFAGEIVIHDPYVRASTPTSKTGAAFLTLINNSDTDDRLIAVSSENSGRVELHTHLEDANGVMRMTEIEGGIAIEAGGKHALKRGGDHIMFMGLSAPLVQGSEITVTLTFEKAREMQVQIPVDHERKPDHAAKSH